MGLCKKDETPLQTDPTKSIGSRAIKRLDDQQKFPFHWYTCLVKKNTSQNKFFTKMALKLSISALDFFNQTHTSYSN